MQPTLVILAAGMGSRYGSLKQVDKLGPHGETIIDYSVFDAMRAGFGKVVFVIRKSIEKDFMEVFASRFLKKVPFEIVFQELDLLPEGFCSPPDRTKPWGTVQAVWVCRDVVKEPFVVINADDFYGREAYETLAGFLKESPEQDIPTYAMCAYKLSNTLSQHGSVTRGVCQLSAEEYLERVDEQYNIEIKADGAIVSHTETQSQELNPNLNVSMNIWAFNPSVFALMEKSLATFLHQKAKEPKSEWVTPHFVDQMIGEKKIKVKVLRSAAQWFGVTYAEDKPQVMQKLKELAENGKYPAKMWETDLRFEI